MSIKIKNLWGMIDQNYRSGNKKWFVSRLIEKAKDLPVKEMDMGALNIYNICPSIESMHDFVSHMKKVLDADLEYPIILDDEGYVMDGRHRIAKAILEGKDSIKYVRFDETPTHDAIVD